MHLATKSTVAIRVISKMSISHYQKLQSLQKQVSLQKTVDHPFISTLFEVFDDATNFYFVQEIAEHGTLQNYVLKSKELSEAEAKKYFCQIVSALKYLHEKKNIIHQNLNTDNILLDKNDNVRLINFGEVNLYKEDSYSSTSLAFLAPEVITNNSYSQASDIWSLGIILLYLVTGYLPFSGEDPETISQQVINFTPIIPKRLSPELIHLLKRILIKDPSQRITIKEIINHHWVRGFENPTIMTDQFVQKHSTFSNPILQNGVVAEMRVLGFDTTNLSQDLFHNIMNTQTTVYKILRRQRVIHEISIFDSSADPFANKLPLLSGSLTDASLPLQTKARIHIKRRRDALRSLCPISAKPMPTISITPPLVFTKQ